MNKAVDIFHVGPQKTATTWVYNCFKEHPQVVTPKKDATHYYTLYYHKSFEWYIKHFDDSDGNKTFFDPTPNYFRSPFAAERIARDNANAKIIICLRDPIERAFSHYWHEKKKKRFNFKFEEVFQNFDLYTNWIEPSMYSVHIERFVRCFGWPQIKIMWFDDLESDPEQFIKELFDFADIDTTFTPSILKRKLNVARPPDFWGKGFYERLKTTLNRTRVAPQLQWLKNKASIQGEAEQNSVKKPKDIETVCNVDPEVIKELLAHFESEYSNLERMFSKDLSAWRKKYSNI